MNIGDRLKKLRKELDLTQGAFAARIGSVQNTITGYESGRRNPSAQVIALISREFGVNEEWLRDGAGEMFISESTDELDALARKYNLSVSDQLFVEKYVNLKPGSRDAIMNFILDVASALSESKPEEEPAAPELDIDAEVEEYRRQLELQKKAEAESSASCTSNKNGENKKEA